MKIIKKLILNQPQVSIILLTYNAIDYTKRCINSIREYTKNISYELIIVDNHSQDGTVQYLMNLKRVKLILNKKNLGWGSAVSQGILASDRHSRFILFLDNDAEVVDKDWLYSMVRYLENNPKVGCIGPKYCTIELNLDYSVGNGKYVKKLMLDPRRAKKITGRNFTKKELLHLFTFVDGDNKRVYNEIAGWCQMHRRKLIEKIGLPDDPFFFSPGDSVYSMRYLLFGYKIEDFNLEKTGKILHYWGRSGIFNTNPNKYKSNLLLHEKLTAEVKKIALSGKVVITAGLKKFLLFLYNYLNDDIYDYLDLDVFLIYFFRLNYYMSKFKFDKRLLWLYNAFLCLFEGANEKAIILIKVYLDFTASKKDEVFLAEALYHSKKFDECLKVLNSLQKYPSYRPFIAKRKREMKNV